MFYIIDFKVNLMFVRIFILCENYKKLKFSFLMQFLFLILVIKYINL